MGILNEKVEFNLSRRTWDIRISAPLNQMPAIELKRESVWAPSDNPMAYVSKNQDQDPVQINGFAPEFTQDLVTVCAALGLDPNVHGLYDIIGALGDFYDPVLNPPPGSGTAEGHSTAVMTVQ